MSIVGSISVKEFFKSVWRQKTGIFLLTMIATFIMAWHSWNYSSLYKASKYIIISPHRIASTSGKPTKNEISINLYANLEKNLAPPALESFIERHNLFIKERENGKSLAALADEIRSGVEINDAVLSENVVTAFRFSYIDGNRENAEAVASALIKDFSASSTDTAQKDGLKIISCSDLPTSAILPNKILPIIFGAVSGFIIGLGGAAIYAVLFSASRRHT